MQQLKIPTPQYEHDTVSLYPAENNNVRIWVQPSYFSSPVSRVRIRLQATPSGNVSFGGMSICEKSPTGNPWDCSANPVKITFSGKGSIEIPSSQERYSDEIQNFTLEQKDYLINYYVAQNPAYFWRHSAAESENPTRYLWWIHNKGDQTMTKTLPEMYTDSGWLTSIYGIEAIQGYTEPKRIAAASASMADVQAALDKAADGDTVEVPRGSANWTRPMYMGRGNTLMGQGNLTVIMPSSAAVMMYSSQPGIRLSGFKFVGGPAYPIVNVNSWSPAFRIDHNEFANQNYAPVEVGAQAFNWRPFGLIDSNIFQGRSSYVRVFSDNYAEWDRPDNFGSSELVYIENNKYIGTGNSVATDSDFGGRFVFRYNEIINSGVHAHAMGQGVNPAPDGATAVRQTEIYNNNFLIDGIHMWGLIYIGGGASLIHHNKIGTANGGDLGGGIITFRNYRGDADQPGLSYSCLGVDACYGSSSYDGNADFVSGTTNCGICNGTTLTASGSPGWENNKWVGYQIFNENDPSSIKSHCQISSSTANTITCRADLAGGSLVSWSNGDTFAIRSGWPCKQQIGRGQRISTNPEVYSSSPARIWSNDKSGCLLGDGCSTWVNVYKSGTCLADVLHDSGNGYRYANFGLPESDDFLYSPDSGGIQDSTYAKSGYIPYTCPHPLAGLSGSCNPGLVGAAGYNIGVENCSSLGGSCCSSGQSCSGSFQSSSDCPTCCTAGTCQTCIHKAEIPPCDGCIDMSELTAFIDRWKVNNQDATIKELIEAIGLWKMGC